MVRSDYKTALRYDKATSPRYEKTYKVWEADNPKHMFFIQAKDGYKAIYKAEDKYYPDIDLNSIREGHYRSKIVEVYDKPTKKTLYLDPLKFRKESKFD